MKDCTWWVLIACCIAVNSTQKIAIEADNVGFMERDRPEGYPVHEKSTVAPMEYTYPDLLHLLGDFYKGRSLDKQENIA
ncbi:Hypothetical predicted protein [Mytilus galloprovincialis]|uniref:Uncharacterized protein n=1 Tax=Mytilus galloprovincialis TaxID=29158 RepID=A0A8B6EMD7_MYTGA|nr:Hypothetical predicted protein [Mytilus galloprovincialis]